MLHVPAHQLHAFCQANRIQRLSLFGSVLKGQARRDSDVDLLVEFEAGQAPSLLGMVRMESELSDMLGQRVDLRTPADLSRYFRQDVLDMAQVQYAA
ncbi:MAG: nucleotidyltransferase domain-containing protein [Hydrogenophaga sp.]|nr:nucleotidyltransferase domain-containing protein [Hydrogenophaga sp.]